MKNQTTRAMLCLVFTIAIGVTTILGQTMIEGNSTTTTITPASIGLNLNETVEPEVGTPVPLKAESFEEIIERELDGNSTFEVNMTQINTTSTTSTTAGTTVTTTAGTNITTANPTTQVPVPKLRDPVAEIQFCRDLISSCPYLQHKKIRPVEEYEGSRKRVKINISLNISRFLGISELDQRMSLQGQIRLQWRLPSCAKWGNDNDTRAVPAVPFCVFPSEGPDEGAIWHPAITHINEIGTSSTLAM